MCIRDSHKTLHFGRHLFLKFFKFVLMFSHKFGNLLLLILSDVGNTFQHPPSRSHRHPSCAVTRHTAHSSPHSHSHTRTHSSHSISHPRPHSSHHSHPRTHVTHHTRSHTLKHSSMHARHCSVMPEHPTHSHPDRLSILFDVTTLMSYIMTSIA